MSSMRIDIIGFDADRWPFVAISAPGEGTDVLGKIVVYHLESSDTSVDDWELFATLEPWDPENPPIADIQTGLVGLGESMSIFRPFEDIRAGSSERRLSDNYYIVANTLSRFLTYEISPKNGTAGEWNAPVRVDPFIFRELSCSDGDPIRGCEPSACLSVNSLGGMQTVNRHGVQHLVLDEVSDPAVTLFDPILSAVDYGIDRMEDDFGASCAYTGRGRMLVGSPGYSTSALTDVGRVLSLRYTGNSEWVTLEELARTFETSITDRNFYGTSIAATQGLYESSFVVTASKGATSLHIYNHKTSSADRPIDGDIRDEEDDFPAVEVAYVHNPIDDGFPWGQSLAADVVRTKVDADKIPGPGNGEGTLWIAVGSDRDSIDKEGFLQVWIYEDIDEIPGKGKPKLVNTYMASEGRASDGLGSSVGLIVDPETDRVWALLGAPFDDGEGDGTESMGAVWVTIVDSPPPGTLFWLAVVGGSVAAVGIIGAFILARRTSTAAVNLGPQVDDPRVPDPTDHTQYTDEKLEARNMLTSKPTLTPGQKLPTGEAVANGGGSKRKASRVTQGGSQGSRKGSRGGRKKSHNSKSRTSSGSRRRGSSGSRRKASSSAKRNLEV